MRIHSESLLNHSPREAFLAYRDHLPEFAPLIDDIQKIVVEKREESDGVVKLHNVWFAQREIPTFAKAFLKPEMLRWDDFADWRDGELRCHWEIKPRAFTDSVKCKGTNTFVDAGNGRTRVLLEGDLSIDLKGIPGVPRLVAGRIGPKVEQFIVSLITPNLQKTNQALGTWMDKQ
ncbi:MAG: hypothetical protein VX899_21640 [Myxococcota bacterium]|nr:hypothetical protein [Myxococcota bacterium]